MNARLVHETLDSFGGYFKHSKRLVQGVSVVPLLREIEEAKDLEESLVQKTLEQSRRFRLRGQAWTSTNKHKHYGNIFRAVTLPNYTRLPKVAAWLETFAKERKGKLG